METGEVRQSFMGSSRQQQHPSDQELMTGTKMAVAQRGSCGSLVLVVVDANKVFTSTAVDWALDHVAKPGDSLLLLGILQHSTNSKSCSLFSSLSLACNSFLGYKSWTDDIHWNGASKKLVDSELSNKRQLLQSNLELHLKCKNLGVKLEIDVKSSINPRALVVEEAKRLGAQHVVFDRGLKKDKKFYIENLTCFVTRVKGIDDVKHLRTGLLLPPVRSPDAEPTELPPRAAAEEKQALVASTNSMPDKTHAEEQQQQQQQPHETISYNSTKHSHQRSSSSYMTCDLDESELLSIHDDEADTVEDKPSHRSSTFNNFEPIYSSNMDTMAVMQWLQEHGSPVNTPIAPPLCSVCNQKSPEFGKPVRRFTYAELQEATDNFNPNNYLAQGGYGSVFKGILQEGQLIAVKQHKIASSQGDKEFCAEVEVLSCARHRNLVTLIGYCVEDHLRLLVYEFVCNGSLDRHLSSKNKEVLLWKHRQKIALGAARGICYLHEECRVGCIVHRDMRPNNILLTHDFTPMVGDFGLARRQFNGETAEETRVIGTFGYLAPEYAETGQITDKADVYAFGVVLLELITGRKAVDNSSNARGERCLTEWARPLLDRYASELVDPRLRISGYDDYEMHCMMHAASQCIKKDPTMRPRMTQVLRILDPSQDKDTPYGIGSRKATSDQRPPFPPPTSNNGVTRTSRISPGSELDSNNEDQQPPLVQTGVCNQVPLPGRKPKSNRMRWKPARSSSAPRLSNDKGTSNKDITDVVILLQRTSLSYESMLDDV
ncbi:unnamed protein product [Sphagnum compactum]